MRIANNIMALNAHRQLMVNQGGVAKSIEKLSSGLRINRAGDDAAGLAISEKMRGQIRGLNQAVRNAQDGISLIQTAEGALNETHAILQRMRELAVQASSDTNTDDDRAEIQKEINQLVSEINRISSDTEFNTKKLLDGSIQNSATLDTVNAAKLSAARIQDDGLKAGDYKVTVSGLAAANVANLDVGGTAVDSVTLTAGDGIGLGSYTVTLTDNNGNVDVVVTDADGNQIGAAYDQGRGGDITVNINGGGSFTLVRGTSDFTEGTLTFDIQASATFTVANSDGEVIGATTVTDTTDGQVTIAGLELEFGSTLAAGDTTVTVETNALSFQIGANEGQNTKLAIADMSAEALGVDNLDLTTEAGASAAITTINNAIITVSAERSKLGAIQNRLEHTITNLGTSAENLQAAESRIRDVDMAAEMMAFTKFQILQQASTAMLAQANLAPQSVLQLLG